MSDNFEVRDPTIEQSLKDIGHTIADTLPPGWGFTLFMFQYGEGGGTFYLSNANRQDMLATLQEFIEKQGQV